MKIKKLAAGFVDLVAMLNDGQYHDGTTLGNTLNITRSAVWKTIKKLEGYHINIHSVKGKGYVLKEPLILLNQKIIKKGIIHKNCPLQLFETIHSTNDYLKTSMHHNKISLCLAEQQTQGKGRFHRHWHSPFGQNIYLSCSYPFQKDLSELSGLSLVVSLAIAKTLKTYDLSNWLGIKWPNDIVYDHKKISGNLIEIQAESHGASHAIIGIGINVNMIQDEYCELSQPWTSLRKATGHYVDRNPLCISLINHLMAYLQLFDSKGLSSFTAEWEQFDYLMKRNIALKNGNKIIHGKAIGIDQQGHLMIELENGSLHAFSSGDTSIIKEALHGRVSNAQSNCEGWTVK
jgi:BirA family transcriptional regulator, biotin operon repressor / biotin---[acetyl-CoA-carboxylase] ligase